MLVKKLSTVYYCVSLLMVSQPRKCVNITFTDHGRVLTTFLLAISASRTRPAFSFVDVDIYNHCSLCVVLEKYFHSSIHTSDIRE